MAAAPRENTAPNAKTPMMNFFHSTTDEHQYESYAADGFSK
jgi:hypothetical protein